MDTRIRAAKPSDAGNIGRVHIDSWQTTYAGIVPAEYLEGLSYFDRESSWREILASAQHPSRTFVAESESGEVVGFAHSGPEREGNATYRGELYAIYLLQEHQGRGLGRQLISHAAQGLLEGGFKSMLLWVLEENHTARRFYESIGGKRVGEKSARIGGRDLVEVSYGWRDINALAAGE